MLTSKTNKKVDIENVSLKNKLDSEWIDIYTGIKEQYERIDYTKPVYICSGKQHVHIFTIFLNLGNFAGSAYNGKLSLKAAKIEQKNMEDMMRKLENPNPKSEKYKTKKASTLLNAKEFDKGKKMNYCIWKWCI